MSTFSTTLVHGTKRPYDTWTFVVVPEAVVEALGAKRVAVRGTLHGVAFRGTMSKGEGVYRMPVPRDLQARAGVACGSVVRVVMDLDRMPRPVKIPPELQEVLAGDAALARHFDALPPAHRRAWASYVGDAKRPETRSRRAAQAPEGILRRSFPGA